MTTLMITGAIHLPKKAPIHACCPHVIKSDSSHYQKYPSLDC